MSSGGKVAGVFVVTDGTTSVTFLADTKGFNHLNWTPSAPTPKGGGQWSESPFTDGRIPVIRRWNNIVDTYELVPFGGEQDEIIVDLITLRRLLQQAVDYWQNDWETGSSGRPVWIEARGDCETNTRYAYIYDYRIPNDDDPYQPPFGGRGTVSIEGFTVILEHGLWRSTPPGDTECLPASSYNPNLNNDENISEPQQSSDDASVNVTTQTVSLTTTSPAMGNLFNDALHIAIRFRDVKVPKNATIVQAYVRFYCPISNSDTTCTVRIYGEKNASPSAFTTTYSNYTSRTLTDAYVTWGNIPAWTAGNYYHSPEIKTIIQEIINLAGWASGNDLVLMFQDYGSSTNANRRTASWDSTDPSPMLYVYYRNENGSIGITTAECDLLPVATRWTTARLDHVLVYDASAGSYTEVYRTTLPHNLLPAVPDAGDAVYFGMSAGRDDFSLFHNIVLELSSFGEDLSESWQYWNGSIWAPLSGQFYPTLIGLGDGGSGRFVYNFYQPSDWTSTIVNGLDAFWVRLYINSVGSSPTPIIQRDIDEFICSWPWIEINEDAIESDLPALLKYYSTVLETASSWTPNRMLIGMRNNRRGTDFVPYLNANTKILPTGMTYTIYSGSETFLPEYLSGYSHVLTYTGSSTPVTVGKWTIYYPYSRQYAGRYRVFLRCKCTAVAGTGLFRLVVSRGNVTVYTSRTMTNYTSNENVIDLGMLNLAGHHFANDTINFRMYVGTTGMATITLFDLVLIPADEMLIDVQTVDLAMTDLMSFITGLYAIHDSTLPKEGVYTIAEQSGSTMANCITRVLGPAQIPPKQNVRLIFFALDTRQSSIMYVKECAGLRYTMMYRNEMVKQYQSMRGTK